MNVEGVDVGQLVVQSPAVVLAVLVWFELRAMRSAVHELAASIAVLADRGHRP
jgi:hypothetical protein